MNDWAELGKEVLKLAVRARYSFSIWGVALLLLVVPLPSFLRLDHFREQFGSYIGIAGLISFVLWVVEVSLLAAEKVSEWRSQRLGEKKTLEFLSTLNSREAHLLVFAVEKAIQTVTWRKEADELSSLVAKGLLIKVPDDSNNFNKPYTVPPFVWTQIRKTDVLGRLKQLDKEKT